MRKLSKIALVSLTTLSTLSLFACGKKKTTTAKETTKANTTTKQTVTTKANVTTKENQTTEKHTHNFNIKNVDDAYVAKDATCESNVTYYYSCSCGEKGTETFTPKYVQPLGHEIDYSGKCIHDGCKVDLSNNVSMDEIKSSSYVAKVYDGYVYLHLPKLCTYYYSNVYSDKGQFFNGKMFLEGGEEFTNIPYNNNNIINTGGAIYNSDIYYVIEVDKKLTEITVSLSSNAYSQNHSFSSYLTMKYDGESLYQYCGSCKKVHSDTAIIPNEIKENEFEVTLKPGETKVYFGTSTQPIHFTHTNSSKINFTQVQADSNKNAAYTYNSAVYGNYYIVLTNLSKENAETTTVTASNLDVITVGTELSLEKGEDYCFALDVREYRNHIINTVSNVSAYIRCFDYVESSAASTDFTNLDYVLITLFPSESFTYTFNLVDHSHTYNYKGSCSCGKTLLVSGSTRSEQQFTISSGLQVIKYTYKVDMNNFVVTSTDENIKYKLYDDYGNVIDTTTLINAEDGSLSFATDGSNKSTVYLHIECEPNTVVTVKCI